MVAIDHDGLAIPGQVALAHELPFKLGALSVDPGTRQVGNGHRNQTLEPRVMQVLVALARANGAVVTRDELIQRCWDGRIVGEDAINRALSRIRRLAADIGEQGFRVETITKVGYRLLVDPAAQADRAGGCAAGLDSPVQPVAFSRRALIGATALAAGAIGVLGWRAATVGHRPTPEARALYRMGIAARSQGLVATSDQATAYFRQAVRADPDYADAWGALARQLTSKLGGTDERTIGSATGAARSAARRALALDADQVDALGTLVITQPKFGRWGTYERALLRFIDEHGAHRPAQLELARLYGGVARWDKTVGILAQVRRASPLLPSVSNLCLALWSAGRTEEADTESAAALDRWPRHHGAWFTRMLLLTYGGNPERALAFAADRAVQPTGDGAEEVIATRIATARALVSRNAPEIAAIGSMLIDSVETEILNVPQAARFFGAIGDSGTMFELIDAYFRRRGHFARHAMTPISPLAPLATDFLFHPTSRILWKDPRFADLTREIGLDSYWKSVGVIPFFRRR